MEISGMEHSASKNKRFEGKTQRKISLKGKIFEGKKVKNSGNAVNVHFYFLLECVLVLANAMHQLRVGWYGDD